MTRLTIYILLIGLTSCVSYKKYRQQEIIEQKTDLKGRLILKKYRQWISSPGLNKLATVTEEYDSVGRVIKTYGFDNPYTYSGNYLIEKIYKGSQVYVTNKYIWKQSTLQDSTFSYNYTKFDSTLKMFSQNIYPDSLQKHKQIRVSLSAKPNSVYYGQFEEDFSLTENSWTTNLFSFVLDAKNIRFDSSRKLILDNIRKN